jgi:hypothetical protein
MTRQRRENILPIELDKLSMWKIVEITHNQQTARKDRKNLQQVRKFTQEDVSLARRLVVNDNNVEAG